MTVAPAFEMPEWVKTAIAPAAPPPPKTFDAAALANEYRDLRDRKKAMKKEFDESVQPITERMAELEAAGLDALNQSNANSIQTPMGTIYRSTRTTYAFEDPHAVKSWAEEHGISGIFENRPSKEFIDTWLAEGNTLPPGVKVSHFVQLNVRK